MANPFQDAVLLLGDSITQSQEVPRSLHERMNVAYARKLDVLNRGYGGCNSNGLKVLLDQILTKKEASPAGPVVRLVTLWLGANDATIPPHCHNVPLPTFISNMNDILHALTSPDSPYSIADTPLSIILIATSPSLPSMFGPDSGREEHRDVEGLRKYSRAVLEIGREWKIKEGEQVRSGSKWKIETIDLWEACVEAVGGEGEELVPLLTDGLHLTSAGYDVLWAEITKVVQTKLQGRGLDWQDITDLPLRVPACDTVDWRSPESIIDGMKLPSFRL